MKIAIFDMDNMKNPHWGSGQAKATYEIAKRLAKTHKVIVYSSKYPDYKNYMKNKVEYIHIGLGTNNPKVNNIVYLLAAPFKALSIRTDIIIENFTAPISTCFIPLFTKTPVVGVSSFFSSGNMDQKYGVNFSSIEKFGSKLYKYFIALNPDDESKMKKLNKKIKSVVIYNGVDKKYLKMKTTEKNYILFIGRIDINQKGLDLLLKSFSLIRDKISSNLYIMGSGSESEIKKVNNLIKKFDLEKRVIMLGKLAGKEKDRYLSESKLVIFPSRYEGHSIASLEALALGKPIICFDISGFSWIDKKTITKIEPFNIKKMALNILKLSRNKTLRKTFEASSRSLARKYTWEESARQYKIFLNYIIKNK